MVRDMFLRGAPSSVARQLRQRALRPRAASSSHGTRLVAGTQSVCFLAAKETTKTPDLDLAALKVDCDIIPSLIERQIFKSVEFAASVWAKMRRIFSRHGFGVV